MLHFAKRAVVDFQILIKGQEDLTSGVGCTQSNKSPPNGRVMVQRGLIGEDRLTVQRELGAGDFGTVHQGVWKNDDGGKVSSTFEHSFNLFNVSDVLFHAHRYIMLYKHSLDKQ